MVSCASSGFDRGKLRARLNTQTKEIMDEDIKKAYKIKSQIQFPLRLAIYFDPMEDESNPYRRFRMKSWRWDEEDQKKLLNVKEQLIASGILSELIIIPNSVIQGTTLKHIRLAAARYQADAVLVIRAGAEVDRYYNPLSVLYITIIGMWMFPGSHYDALFMIEGTMWDVGNEYLYLTAGSEGTFGQVRPEGFIEEKDVILPAKKEAVEKFSQELVERLQSIKNLNAN